MDAAHGAYTLVAGQAVVDGAVQDTAQLAAERTYQATVRGTGAVTATIIVYVSNDTGDDAVWETLVTFTLSGTTTDTASLIAQHRWAFTKASITAISGTNAIATVSVGA